MARLVVVHASNEEYGDEEEKQDQKEKPPHRGREVREMAEPVNGASYVFR